MKKAFTLVELLVVLVIIGVLIGLILPNTLKAIRQANNKECASNLRTIDTAIHLCYSDKRNWAQCDSIPLLKSQHYLEEDPLCPFGIPYTLEDSGDIGKRSAKLAHFDPWPPGSTTSTGSGGVTGRVGDHK